MLQVDKIGTRQWKAKALVDLSEMSISYSIPDGTLYTDQINADLKVLEAMMKRMIIEIKAKAYKALEEE